VKELRLRGISSIEAANEYAPEFITDFNNRFAVQPRSSHNAHRPLLPSDDLNLIFTKQKMRILSKNLTLQYMKVIYQIQTSRPSYAMRKAQVTVCEDPQGDITIIYKGRPLDYTVFHKQHRQAEVVASKSIDAKFKIPHKPAKDHPWRTYGHRISGKPIKEAPQHESTDSP
jgi:hypothetical protein